MMRTLPSGEFRAATLRTAAADVATIGRPVGLTLGECASLPSVGDLVEVQAENAIYLGQVRSTSPESADVAVEHVVDRKTLMEIQRIWRRPEV
jgi:hypothetical protein